MLTTMTPGYVDARVVDAMRVYSNPSSSLNSARAQKPTNHSRAPGKGYSVRNSSAKPVVSTRWNRNPSKVYVTRKRAPRVYQNIPATRNANSGNFTNNNSNKQIHQSFNINVIAVNRREKTSARGKKDQPMRSPAAEDKSSKSPSTPNDDSTYDVISERKYSNKVAANQGARDHVARLSSNRSDVSSRRRGDENLPAIANYKNKRLFKGLRPGQSEILKELAKTTDVRKDLFNLQKRKIEILTSLEKNMTCQKPKSMKRPADHNEKELRKCPMYYKNLTQSTAAFLPVDDGRRHYKYDQVPRQGSARSRGSARSNSSRSARHPFKSSYRSPYLEEVKAQRTTVRTHRADSRHKATLKKAPEVLSSRDYYPRGPHSSKGCKRLIPEELSNDISKSSSIGREKTPHQYENQVPVELRNVLVNVNVPLRTTGSRRTTPSPANSRWPLIANGQALEANMEVLDMGDARDKEWCTLEAEERQTDEAESKNGDQETDKNDVPRKEKRAKNSRERSPKEKSQRKSSTKVKTPQSASPTKPSASARSENNRNESSRVMTKQGNKDAFEMTNKPHVTHQTRECQKAAVESTAPPCCSDDTNKTLSVVEKAGLTNTTFSCPSFVTESSSTKQPASYRDPNHNRQVPTNVPLLVTEPSATAHARDNQSSELGTPRAVKQMSWSAQKLKHAEASRTTSSRNSECGDENDYAKVDSSDDEINESVETNFSTRRVRDTSGKEEILRRRHSLISASKSSHRSEQRRGSEVIRSGSNHETSFQREPEVDERFVRDRSESNAGNDDMAPRYGDDVTSKRSNSDVISKRSCSDVTAPAPARWSIADARRGSTQEVKQAGQEVTGQTNSRRDDPDKNIDTEAEKLLMENYMKEVPSESYNSSGATEQVSADNVNKQKAPILGDIGQVVVRSKVKDLQEFEKRSKVKDPESNDEINHYQGDVIKQTEDLEEEDKEEEEVVKSQEETEDRFDTNMVTYSNIKCEQVLLAENPEIEVEHPASLEQPSSGENEVPEVTKNDETEDGPVPDSANGEGDGDQVLSPVSETPLPREPKSVSFSPVRSERRICSRKKHKRRIGCSCFSAHRKPMSGDNDEEKEKSRTNDTKNRRRSRSQSKSTYQIRHIIFCK